MRFADPQACPDCRGAIAGQTVCQHCGLDLTSPEIRQLWQTLLQADELLARAPKATRPPVAENPPLERVRAPQPAYVPPTAPAPARSISPGSILLGLGALCILVAGFVFLTVAWGSLGVTGRALVLLAFTAAVGGIGAWVTGRNLRGSAEAIWAVFLGLFTLDWFAAYDQGLWGLDAAPFTVIATVWAAVLFALSSVITVRSHAAVGRNLLTTLIAAGVAPWFGATVLGVQLVDEHDWRPFWAALVATAFASAFLVLAVRLRHHLTAALLGGFAAVGAVIVVMAAVVEAVETPSLSELTRDGHGLPLLLTIVVAVAVGLLERRATMAAAAFAGLATALLIVLPVDDAWPERGAYLVGAALVLAGASALRGSDTWSTGGRIATAVVGLVLGASTLPWVANLGSIAGDGAQGGGGADFWTRSTAIAETPGPWWLAGAVFGALTAGVFLTRWWPEVQQFRPQVIPVAAVLGAAGLLSAVAATSPAYAVLALVMIAVGAVLAELLRRRDLAWTLVGPALVAVAPVVPLVSTSATLAVWLLAAAVLAVVAVGSTDRWCTEPAAFAAAGWAMGAAGIAAVLAQADDDIVALCLVAAAVVGLVVASMVLRSFAGRIGVEAAVALVATVGLGLAAGRETTLPWQALLWTITGAALVLLSFATPDRRFFQKIGAAALGVAYVLRLIASDVEVVEAYTLPFAIVLLAAGWWAMRGDDAVDSVRALAPGLTLALLPSLPQALDAPASLRSLLLGLGALAVLAIGARKHWRAPFVAGAVVVGVLAIANLGPYAFAIPRWVLIAGTGALLLGAGVTWEDRVRDGRAVARYLVSMR